LPLLKSVNEDANLGINKVKYEGFKKNENKQEERTRAGPEEKKKREAKHLNR
jgi:hypothetical protein